MPHASRAEPRAVWAVSPSRRGLAPDSGFDFADPGDAAQAFGGNRGAVLQVDRMQFAPGMGPAVSQRQRGTAPAPGFGQGVTAAAAVDLQDAVEAAQISLVA